MKLRKPCPHDLFDAHWINWQTTGTKPIERCPGGVFLPDDTLVIEKVDREWPEWAVDRLLEWFYDHDGTPLVPDSRLTYIEHALDALSVREAESDKNQLGMW